mgnify:CR=1 FL=1
MLNEVIHLTIKTPQPKQFQAKISHCGTDVLNGTYSIEKDNSAIRLMVRLFNTMVDDMVGKKLGPQFKHDFAVLLLSSITGYDQEALMKAIEKAAQDEGKGLIDAWTLAKEDENPQETSSK